MLLPLETSNSDHPTIGKPQVFLRTPASERDPAFSPDGRWIAYTSDESGQFEIYVRPFPGPGSKWRVSTAGGRLPAWSRSGRQFAYETLENRLMVVTYSVNGQTFTPGKPRLWSSQRIFYSGQGNMDFAPDGKKFAVLMPVQAAEEGASALNVLVNFLDELRRRVPGGK